MKTTKEEKELIQKFEKIFQKEIEIVDIFNSLSETTYEKYYSKIEIQEDEKLIIFQLVENKLKYLEQSAHESNNNIKAILAITVFKTLFMEEKSFKMKGLEDKKLYFHVLLKLLKNEELNDEKEQKVIKDMLYEIEFNQNYLLNQLIQDYDEYYFFAYCFYLINNSSTSNKLFFDTFISFLKAKYKEDNENLDLELKIDESITEQELDKISMKNILINLYNIYINIDNYAIILIENQNLLIKKMDLKEIEKIIQKNNEKIEKKKNKSNKKKKKKRKKKPKKKKKRK